MQGSSLHKAIQETVFKHERKSQDAEFSQEVGRHYYLNIKRIWFFTRYGKFKFLFI